MIRPLSIAAAAVLALAVLLPAGARAEAAPIDPTLFDAGGRDLRSFTKEIDIDAPAARAYALWTDAAAWTQLMGGESRANFDLEIGGRYEWLFNGTIGSNGCQVLSYIPDRMVSFTWNAPPGQATRERRTWVVVETTETAPGRTHVRLTHLGFGQSADWDTTFTYFDNAWGRVLPMMKQALEAPVVARAGEEFVVTADNVRIHYTDQGAGEPTLVFVHGWSCDGTYWGAQVPEFAKTHRVITVDLAGHGVSSANRATYTMDLFGEDVVTVLKALDLKDVILVGHSMGGAVIVEAALLAPDRVAGLIGVENFQNINLSLPESAIVNFMAPFRANFHDSVEEWVSGMFVAGPGTELARAVSADMASAPEDVALGAMAEMMSWYGSAPIKRMRKLAVPLMSINVDIPATDVEALKGIIPAYQCRVMAKHGHFLMREDPEGFNKLLAETLAAMADLKQAQN